MASAGRRYIETVDAIANAPIADFADGTLMYDIATGALYLAKSGAWAAVTVA